MTSEENLVWFLSIRSYMENGYSLLFPKVSRNPVFKGILGQVEWEITGGQVAFLGRVFQLMNSPLTVLPNKFILA